MAAFVFSTNQQHKMVIFEANLNKNTDTMAHTCSADPQVSDLPRPQSSSHLLVLRPSVQVSGVSESRSSSAPLLPVLHACLIGHTLLQGQAIHLQEVFHVLNLSGDSLFPESLQLSVIGGPGLWLIQTLVRMVAVDPAPDALAVCHRQHLAAAAAAALPNTAACRCRFGDLQVFRRTVTGLAPAGNPRGASGVPSRKHAPPPHVLLLLLVMLRQPVQ